MQRIAVPMIDGMVSSTLLTLIVIPAIYGLAKGRNRPKTADGASDAQEREAPPLTIAAE
jgi:Cu(I)/Ag(I) efflux system membrane protein CusA/SilA